MAESVIKTTAIVPAAGKGLRMGTDRPKQFLELGGKPVIVHTILALASSENITEIIPVISEDCMDEFEEVINTHDLPKVTESVKGGAERQDSVRNGIEAADSGAQVILIHDAVRPFITKDLVDRVIFSANDIGGAIAAVVPNDTIKILGEGNSMSTPDRGKLRKAQTPQAFRADIIRDAYRKAYEDGFCGTDDASLVERIGLPVLAVEGLYQNLKITTEADLVMADAIFRDWKIK